MTPEDFEVAFDSRTLAYLQGVELDRRAVVVFVGEGADTAAGHVLATSFVNQLARAHKEIVFVGELDRPLRCRSPFGHRTLREATIGLAREIHPAIEISDAVSSEASGMLSIGIGGGTAAELQVGCSGWLAEFGPDAAVEDRPESIWGAMLASCLAATVAFHRARGRPETLTGRFSAWEFAAANGTDGPAFSGPIEVGRVLQVGAGAVGSSLDYWLSLTGVDGGWTIVDGDDVDASNLNRQLMFLARDAGYDAVARNKATVAAERLGNGATAVQQYYSLEVADEGPAAVEFHDVLLALANEHGAREILQGMQPTVLLHATTSLNWEAQFHRHVAGHDDCIVCRLPGEPPRLKCATGNVGTEEHEVDAALPFLSATAGLLLGVALAQLQVGALMTTEKNLSAVAMESAQPFVYQRTLECGGGCLTRLPPDARGAPGR